MEVFCKRCFFTSDGPACITKCLKNGIFGNLLLLGRPARGIYRPDLKAIRNWRWIEVSAKGAVAHYSLAYSALAFLRIGRSGSASFQRVRKS